MRTYHFQCCTCGEIFNVQSKYLVQKNSLVCPNCSAKLSDATFDKLKAVAVSLKEYDENHPENNKNENEKYFNLTIQ